MADELLQTALRHHRAGAYQQAERLYRALLGQRPDHPDALHLLGLLAHQRGRHQEAVELIERALAIQPTAAAYHCNLAEAYRALGRLNEAVASAQMAVQLQPEYPEALNNLALALLAQNEFAAAEAHLRDALCLQPGSAMMHNNLGNALREQGRHDAALQAYREAVRLDPQLAQGHSNLGQLLLQEGAAEEGLVHLREALRLNPEFPEAHSNLGNVLRQLGQLGQARTHYQTALRLNPGLAMVYNNLGQLSQEEGNLDEALQWYQQALRREPRTLRFHLNLASALTEQEKFGEAVARYRLAQRLAPGNALVYNGLAHALTEQGELEQGVAAYQQALGLNPELAVAHAGLGHAYQQLGRLDEADACFRAALQHNPKTAGAYVGLAARHRGAVPGDQRDAMRQLLEEPYLPDGQLAALHYGLAQVLDADGEYAAAAEHLRQANALRRADWEKRRQGYDPGQHAAFVERSIATFDSAYFRSSDGPAEQAAGGWGRGGLDSEVPVFIVGLPRSGTTLTEQILASHPQVFGGGELPLARQGFESLPGVLGVPDGPHQALRQLLQGPDDERARVVRELAAGHLEQLRKLDPGALRIVDKMPDNYLYLGWIVTLFPRARIIHCRRDVRDVALSCWMTHFQSIRWACHPEHIATRIEQYRRLMEHWRQVLPVPILEVDYEQTVTDLEGTARRLLAAVGLDWHPNCLEFHRTDRPVRTASLTQVRRPIYTHSVARWKHYEAELGSLFARIAPCHPRSQVS